MSDTPQEADTRPEWVKQVQDDAERLTLKRLNEDKEDRAREEAEKQPTNDTRKKA